MQYVFILTLLSFVWTSCQSASNVKAPHVYTNLESEKRVNKLSLFLATNPGDTRKRHELVSIYIEEMFFDLAAEQLQAIIDIDPGDMEAYQLLAIVIYQGPTSDLKTAIKVLLQAVARAPSRSDIRIHLALYYYFNGDLRSAESQCKTALNSTYSTQDVTASVHALLSVIYDDLRQKQFADDHYQKAVKLNPAYKKQEELMMNLPVYVGNKPLFQFVFHPATRERLIRLNQQLQDMEEMTK